ncbi:MAG: hypothetical protein K8R37_11435, partial [Bacteroidales bacterium]|nr:hypothetical protein [Bacteroidales bacterium]
MRSLLQFIVLVFLGLSFTNLLTGQRIVLKPEKVLQPEAFTTTIPLRDMEFVPATGKTNWKNGIVPNHDYSPPQRNKNGQKPQKDGNDPVLQTKYNNSAPDPKAIIQNFEGISNISSVAPPDTDGDVGPNHYIQIVNLSFQIFDKSGTALTSPASLSTIWNNLPGPWSGTNHGDPIALYDELTDRWLLSQFSLPNYPSGPFYELIAISASGDPLGSYHLYAYQFTDMPDYPKFGVWPDGYYMSINQFSSGSLSWAGAGAVVFEKSQMLDGNTAQMVFFNFSASQDPWSFLPCDLDGPQPPPNTPNYFAYVNYWSITDRLRIYQLTVDWVNTGNSTFTGPYDVTVATINNNFSTDIIQPGTAQRLDPIEDRLMYRLQYRNFGSYQTLVTNHTVDVGSDRAGVRWYELRNSGGGWSMYQQGTYAPADAHSRWMASVAMNRNGDIALGYSISSSSLSPSIRYTGRLSTDTPGQMTQAETTIITGSGYQSGTYRWGDYSAMSIDPVDDYTFWYTQEYVNPGGSFAWRTRIASFQFGLPPVPDTWTGIASNNWNDANNWNDLSAPYRSDNIIIQGSPLPPFYPVYTGDFTLGLQSNDLTLNSGAEMKVTGDLTISAGRSLTCSSTEKIYVDGNWTNNNGTFTPGTGTVEFNGSNTATINSSTGNLSFWNLDINKANATVITNCFVNINNDLTVRSGAWFTNATGNTMNVTGNALFEADAVSMASYIDNGTLNVTGTTTVELYLTEMKWHYVSPPISDAKLGVF